METMASNILIVVSLATVEKVTKKINSFNMVIPFSHQYSFASFYTTISLVFDFINPLTSNRLHIMGKINNGPSLGWTKYGLVGSRAASYEELAPLLLRGAMENKNQGKTKKKREWKNAAEEEEALLNQEALDTIFRNYNHNRKERENNTRENWRENDFFHWIIKIT